MGVHTWRPWWLISIARSVYSSGLGTIIGAAVPAYLLLLYDCSVALLGLGYIAIFFLILGSGPLPSAARWTTGWDVEDVQRDDRADRADIERAPSQSSPHQTSSSTAPLLLRNLLAVGMDGEYDSGTRLWLDDMTSNQPWVALHLLCCLATLDFTLQALLPAFASTFQGWSHDLPWAPSKSAVLDFMSRIVGVDPDAYGTDFALRLARPMILLATTALIKYLYAIGVAHDQVRRFNLIDTGQALDGVEQVESEMALNLNLKDNIGLFSGFLPRMGILHSSKLAIVAILVAAMDVPSAMGMAYIVGSTLGTAFLAPPRTRSSAGQRALASFLLFSAATVAALWTCARYAIHMPFLGVTYVEKSDALMAWLHWLGVIDRGEDLDSVSSAGIERSLRPTMAIAASISFKYITLQWLDGLPACIRDDPESLTIALYGSACPSWLGPALTARTSTYSTRWTERVNRHFFKHLLYKIFGFYSNSSVNEVNNEVDNEDAPFLEEAEDKEFVNLWQAAREWMERWFADWGMDIVFLTLLIAAFLSANVYSLLYFFAVVLGMTNHHRLLVGVTVIWTWVILPLIALSLVWMYYVTGVGPPPPLPHWPLSALLPQSHSPDVDTWLGLSGGMNVPALLTISAAYFLAVCHLQSKSYESGIGTPHSGSNGPLTNDQRALWAPLTRDAMPTWRLHDRIRYAMYRRSLEALLIAVVLVCVMENDIIHAGYLAIALFFFRSRLTLRAKRNSAFAILPAYNMAVMAVALAYQAPIPNSSGDELHGSSDCGGNSTWDWGQDCTLGHLLGLYKLTLDCDTDQGTCTPRIFSSYGYRTAAVDLLLWLLIRLQTHVFGSSAFVDAASVVEAQEEEERERRREMERQWMDDQATAALFESKHREARNARILRMKQDGGGWLEVFKAEQGDERNEKHADGTESVVVQPESVPTDLGKDNEIEAEVGSSMVETRDRHDAKIISKSKNKNKRKSEAMLPLTEYERHLAEASTPNLDQVGPSNARGGRAPLARESLPAYVLFVVAYLADLSLFSLLLPLSAFAYSLVSVRPSRMYWHVVLVYCELLIVAGFAFRVPARLGCEWAADPDVVKKAKIWGLHSDAFLSIPLFLVYLVTLHHVQGLAVRHAAGQRLAAAALDGDDGEGSEERSRTTSRHQTVVPWLSRALAAVSEFLMQACTPSERPPSFLLVDVGTPLTAALEAHEVESRLQRILDTSTELKTSIDIHLRSHFPIPEPESVDEGRYIRRYLFQAVVRHAKHRCLNPSATAAEILLSKKAGQEHDESNAVPYKLLRVESHSRGARDYYAATATLDLLALLYVAVFYNRVVSAAGSISEITSQHAVPIGFLLTLMILFGFVVLDRVVYSLGSTAGKFVLHLIEMALLFSYCSFLAWSPRGPSQSWLIAVFLAIKAASFALSALQLRSGYPPPASYVNGMGRHTFVFMRSISVPSSIAFHIFTAIPFLYEMRQLLDWACTPTTLTLYDWLKLEDINVGLYFAAVMKKAKSGRPLGVPQPRYLKFFQGTLLFSALLILIWVPLLVFSTGNPTYQPPAVTTFSVNATLHLNTTGGVIRTPVYTAGDSGTWKLWAGSNGTLPRPLAPDYVVDQVVTLCSRPDADDLWSATPPARKRISGSKLHARHPGAIELGVVVVRDLPPPSDRGSGPVCVGTVVVPLTRGCLVEVAGLIGMDGRNRNRQVPLVRQINDSASTTAMFPAFWLLRGDSCESRPLRAEDLASSDAFLVPGRSSGESAKSEYLNWADRWVACNVSLDKSDNESAPVGTLEWYPQWWRFDCGLVDSTGQQHMEDVDEADGRAVCPRGEAGPSITVVLDRVQGGIIGATLNKYGVLGLYSVFVYGIGRFLRLGITNLRMRIPYEDLPTTRRLVALCQDIYIARAEGLLELEEELYSVLLAVYRLPSVMYSLTKKNV